MKKFFIDTDIGSDCDDAGALALLHHLLKKEQAELIGCTHCGSDIGGAITIEAINSRFGQAGLPIGRFTKHPFLEEEVCKKFTSQISENYLAEHPMPEFEDAVKVLRRALAQNKDVTLITIGMFNNIAELLRSKPDEISEKTGVELCRDSVSGMYSMGGHFADASYIEYNIKCDIESARYVAEHFPKPIHYIGFEVGEPLLTGKNLSQADENCPMKLAYRVFSNLRPSWDPATVYCALRPNNAFFQEQTDVTILFDKDGRTVIKNGGKDGYFKLHAPLEQITEEIDRYIADV